MRQPYLTEGSALTFDQLGHVKWPGETSALREVLGTAAVRLETPPGFPGPTFMRWRRRLKEPLDSSG